MRSILTLALAGLIRHDGAAPASAGNQAKRSSLRPDRGESRRSLAAVTCRVAPGAPGAVYQQPGACFTDEGYGRFTPCDVGGGN